MPFGMHRGRRLDEIADSLEGRNYLWWLVANHKTLGAWLRKEIKAVLGAVQEPDEPDGTGLVAAVNAAVRQWHREQIRRWHPDREGDHKVCVALTDAHARLREILDQVFHEVTA